MNDADLRKGPRSTDDEGLESTGGGRWMEGVEKRNR